MTVFRELSEKDLAQIGIVVSVQEGPKPSLFARLMGAKRRKTIQFSKDGVVLQELKSESWAEKPTIRLTEYVRPHYVGGVAENEGSTYFFEGRVARPFEEALLQGLGLTKTGGGKALLENQYNSLPIPEWVGADGNGWPYPYERTASQAKRELEEFLRAMPPELLPSWARPPQE